MGRLIHRATRATSLCPMLGVALCWHPLCPTASPHCCAASVCCWLLQQLRQSVAGAEESGWVAHISILSCTATRYSPCKADQLQALLYNSSITSMLFLLHPLLEVGPEGRVISWAVFASQTTPGTSSGDTTQPVPGALFGIPVAELGSNICLGSLRLSTIHR